MSNNVFDDWCESTKTEIAPKQNLHILREKDGARSIIADNLDATVLSHYLEPKRMANRILRLGYPKAAQYLQAMLPCTVTGRSGHLGEILATEAVPALMPSFYVPIKRLRWLDGRDSALRGEDFIGIEHQNKTVRFLKGESKSRINMRATVVAEARTALNKNHGPPSQHAMGFIVERLFENKQDELAYIFEKFMFYNSFSNQNVVQVSFSLSENDPSTALTTDLAHSDEKYEQHAISFQIAQHMKFVETVYERVKKYVPDT